MRLILIALLLTASASAQSAADSTEVGTVVGTVTDAETGAQLIGANVWLVGTRLGAATDIEGRYEIRDVAVGRHAVRTSYVGYEPTEVEVMVASGETLRLDPSLDAEAWDLCGLCIQRPQSLGGVYRARVVVQRADFRYCTPLYPGDSYTVSR